MPTKLDPELARMAEDCRRNNMSDLTEVVVMVALAAPPDASDTAALEAAGLTVRSQVGDIMTGTIAVDHLEAVAAHPSVVAIEGSRPLDPEADEDLGG